MPNTHHISVPQLGEGIHHVKIRKILRETGEWVDEDSDLVEIETDKATYEVPAPASGYVSKILCKAGEQLNVGEPLFELESVKPAHKEDNKKDPPPQPALNRITNQVRKGDQLRTKESGGSHTLPYQQIELIESLTKSKDLVVPATIEKQISWNSIEEIRKGYRKAGKGSETPSALEIISYAAAQSMHQFEKFKAKLTLDNSIDINTNSIIGIAISLPNDVLVTPAVSISSTESQETIFSNIRNQIQSFQNNPDIAQSQYHSVSISSMSALGVTRATPVIVHPAIATLFIGAPFQALSQSGNSEKVCNLILSFDHRLINGAYAAKFLNYIEKTITYIKKGEIT